MQVNQKQARKYLKQFDFTSLFVEELGWDCADTPSLPLEISGDCYNLEAIAQKRGTLVYHCEANGKLPNHATRRKIDQEVTKYTREHFIIYTDAERQEQVWQWIRREPGKPLASREQRFHLNQSGDLLIQKLEAIAISLEDEESLTLTEVTRRTKKAFDVDKITKKFYDRFKKEHDTFLKFVQGIDAQFDKEWYASLMLNRLMFIYFIQKKGFLDRDTNYLQNRLQECQRSQGQDEFYSFYRYFLLRLFHDGLGKQNRTPELEKLLGRVPYLNGGLFEVHHLEQTYPDIQIPDGAFEQIFVFFDQYDWHLDDRPLRNDNEINPDVLGYIFEKYINQKQMGAYYTKEDITEYISKNCIIPFLFDATEKRSPDAFVPDSAVWQLLKENPNRYIYEAVQKGVDIELPDAIAAGIKDVSQRGDWNKPADDEFALPTEIWREHIARRQRCLEVRQKLANGEVHSINDLITYNLNIRQFAQDAIENCEAPELLWAFYQVLEQMSVLDPTCGSGAFLFAALNILEPLYDACLERMQSFLDERTASGHEVEFRALLHHVEQHPNRRYFILKSIIINNLYGVDIMEEATEICKLRLFLKLVAQVEPDEHENNFGVEPLPDIDFNIRAGNTLVGFASYEEVKKAVKGEGGQTKLDLFDDMDRIDQRARAVDQTFQEFRALQTKDKVDGEAIAARKAELRSSLDELRDELDRYLADEYEGGQSQKLTKFKKWKESHQPFHWFVEFYGIIKRGGFDVIIGNPPYVEYKNVRSHYAIRGFSTEECADLYAFVMERSLNILKQGAMLGMITPVSIVSTDGFAELRNYLLRNSKYSWSVSFAERPSKLFTGVEKRLTIWLTQKGKFPKAMYLSAYQRWLSEEREVLFPKITFVKEANNARLVTTAIPKVSTALEISILNKLSNQKPINQFITKNSNHIVFYTRKLRYFVQFYNFIPRITNCDGDIINPSELKELLLKTTEQKDIAIALLNSSLFFWFFNAYSDVRNVNRREINFFRCSIDSVKPSFINQFQTLCRQLMEDFKANSRFLTNNYGKFGILTIQSFQPRLSKDIIDEIDRVLAQHYGFTDEELDFIINYDIKYRMGREAE